MKKLIALSLIATALLSACSQMPQQQGVAAQGNQVATTQVQQSSTNTRSKSFSNANTDTTQKTNVQTKGDQYNELANFPYDGKHQIVTINNNHTTFTKDDLSLKNGNWQTFSNLDSLNRVGVANAMLSKSMMPKAKREPLYVDPTGWKNKRITVNGKSEWLYNSCHLIGYQFTGENNNLKNLMTGTRQFNDPAMLTYEDKVATYLRTTGNHVRYQVEPIFKGNELVARGVHMQAKSVEDNQLEFNVFIYNVEPGMVINYQDGTSKLE